MFKNNYYYYGGNITINPFQPLSAIEEFINHQKMIQFTKDLRKKEEKKVMEIIEDRERICDKIIRSYASGMTPFLLSSLNAYISLAELCGTIQGKFNHLFVLDVRKLNQATVNPTASLGPKSSGFSDEMLEVKYNLARILAEGGLFLISVDESISDISKEENQLVSTLNSLYNQQCLPQGILNKEDLFNPSVFKKILQGTDFEKATSIHPNTVIAVWGRQKLEIKKDHQEMLEKIKRKYERKAGVAEGIDMISLSVFIIGK